MKNYRQYILYCSVATSTMSGLTAITTADPYQVTTTSGPASSASIIASVVSSGHQVNPIVFPTSVTASMSQAANHLSSQVRKMQENTLMVCVLEDV